MRVLVIGGTGTMGRSLVSLLSQDRENKVYVISRNNSRGGGYNSNTHYIIGNALDTEFMSGVLKERYDCIIDFMWYTADSFLPLYESLLSASDHYIVMSSGAVSADSDDLITEDMPRFYDICTEKERKKSQEYHIAKARIENILIQSDYDNWTIVRPHVTFNTNRLPLFIWGKEQWLYRVLQGHTVILSRDMLEKRTVLTYGGDVAVAIIKLIGNERAFGEIINITSGHNISRKELIEAYAEILEDLYNVDFKIKYIDNIKPLMRAFPHMKDRIENDRMLNRTYDISKLEEIIGPYMEHTDFYESLSKCLKECVDGLRLDSLCYSDGHFCAYMDRMTGEKTPLKYFNRKNRIKYLMERIFPLYTLYANFLHIMKQCH